jgi:hypothetical protein
VRVPAFPTTYMYGRRPLTRLEGALYGIVGAILLALFAERLLSYMELAEKAAMQATVSNLTFAINARVALEMVSGHAPPPGRWSGRNPFEIAGPSSGMARPLGSQTIADLERPSWTYDGERGEVIYLPRLYRGLQTQDPDGALRFRLLAHTAGFGYRLVSTSGYEWDVF